MGAREQQTDAQADQNGQAIPHQVRAKEVVAAHEYYGLDPYK